MTRHCNDHYGNFLGDAAPELIGACKGCGDLLFEGDGPDLCDDCHYESLHCRFCGDDLRVGEEVICVHCALAERCDEDVADHLDHARRETDWANYTAWDWRERE